MAQAPTVFRQEKRHAKDNEDVFSMPSKAPGKKKCRGYNERYQAIKLPNEEDTGFRIQTTQGKNPER